jgi:hypothetical protein
MDMRNNGQISWEDLLSSAARLQKILPEAVLVGGTAAALHVHHRVSFDADHVVPDLQASFNEILAELESVAGWETNRIKTPVLILGRLDGVDTGVRQLIRKAPLETEIIRLDNQNIVVPTMAEILRIKGLLILKRNATRDYLDFAALADELGPENTCSAFSRFDELYPQKNDESPLMQLQIQLAKPMPYDLEGTDLSNYKNLQPRWHNWGTVKGVCVKASLALSREMEKPFLKETRDASSQG